MTTNDFDVQAYAAELDAARIPRLTTMPSLTEPVATLDGALYIASFFARYTALIYCTTKVGVANPITGELYRVLCKDRPEALNPADGWEHILTITAAPDHA